MPDLDVVRVRVDLSYDGTGFAGWARQPGQRTVQGVVEAALETVLRVPVALTVAGRTDSGVHATGQVAHGDVPGGHWDERGDVPHGHWDERGDVPGGHWDGRGDVPGARRDEHGGTLVRRLAGVLPADVRVRAVRRAPDGFDARFSALRRGYVYRVADAPWGVEPLRRHDTLGWPRPLDVAAMAAAARGLLGEHDFAAYCRRREGATTVRALQRLDCERGPDGVVTATVEADAFCHSMVRSLVGALLAVGDGRRPAGWPADLLRLRQRAGEVVVAPAHGLTLVRVDYPSDDQLAARAAVTRQVRVLPGDAR